MASIIRQIVRSSVSPGCRGFHICDSFVHDVTGKFGGLVAQTDASGGHTGGAVGWIIRDYKNNCLCRKLVWVPKITESTCLELCGVKHILYSFAGTAVAFEVVTDCKAAIETLHHVKKLLDKGHSAASIIKAATDLDKKKLNHNFDRQRKTEIALDILYVLGKRYHGSQTVLKLVGRNDTQLSHHLSNFVRTYFEEVQNVYEGERFEEFEVWDDEVIAMRKLRFLREHSLCTDVYKCIDTSGDVTTQKFIFSHDASSPSLGIKTMGGLMQIVVPRNAVGPIEVHQLFSTYFDYQESVVVQIYEGERSETKYNRLWGKIEIEIAPAPKGVPKIAVCFDISASNYLSVTICAEEKSSKQEFVLSGPRTKLTKEVIEYMFDQADSNALEDEKRKKNMEEKVAWIYDTTKLLSLLKDEESKAKGQDKQNISDVCSCIIDQLKFYSNKYIEDADQYKVAMGKVEEAMQRTQNSSGSEWVKWRTQKLKEVTDSSN